MRKEEIYLIERDTIQFEVEATVTIQKTTTTNIIHHAKDDT